MNKMIKELLSVFILSISFQTGLTAQDLIPVNVNGVYGFNRNGNTVIKPQFLYATHFSEGLALVKTKTGWGYINDQGSFTVEPKYTNAEPIRDGMGKVYLDKKCGIVSNKGAVLLEPIYDSIVFGYYDNYVYLNKLMGQANDDFSQITPIIYKKFEANRSFVSAEKSNGLWDIYHKDTLVLEDLQTPVDYDHYLFNSNTGLLKQNGKYGVYRADRGWIFEPQFDTIIRFPFQRHTIADNYFDEIYLLQNTVAVPMSDLVETRFKVMTGDGNLISQDEFLSAEQASSIIGMQQNNGPIPGLFFYDATSTTLLYEDLSIRKMPYNQFTVFLNWFIVNDGNQQSILDAEFKKIDSFDAVERIVNAGASEYYDDFGNLMETATVYDYLPYLKVSKFINGDIQSALYSLYDKKVVSPFMTNASFQSSINGYEEMFSGYTYTGNQSDNRGIYMVGMEMGTELNYLEVNFYNNSQCVAFNPKTELYELLEVRNGKLQLLMQDYSIAPAYTLIQSYEFFDDTLGEFSIVTSQSYFENHFMISKSIDDKLGLLCQNGVRIPSEYDSILQNVGMSQFLDVYKNGLYGAVNLKTGEVIDAVSSTPMTLDYSAENKTHFATILDDNGTGYYIGTKGIFYSIEPLTYSKVVDVNGKKGVQGFSDFTGTSVELIPPLYKKIVILNDGYTPLFVATSTEGKIGVLDVNGDTLAPFEFNGYSESFFNNEQSILILRKGKKEAVYDYHHGELVPPLYDSWNELLDLSGNYSFIQVKSDKKLGLYSMDGKQLLPCVYDCINVISTNSEDMQYKAIQVQRNGKWWVAPIFVPDQNSFYYDGANQTEIFFDSTQFNGPFDFLINDYGYVQQPNGEFISHWANVPKAVMSESAPFEPVLEGALEIIQESGKLGLRQDGKVVLKPTFTNIRFYDDATIIVSDGGSNFYYDLISKKRYKLEQW
ncbi:MAG: WG repeat-containing protein [Fluviicola sp.]|nr:WG repeat-containing protein [Fluviicola sp.]